MTWAGEATRERRAATQLRASACRGLPPRSSGRPPACCACWRCSPRYARRPPLNASVKPRRRESDMPRLRCPDCGKQVSSAAPICPSCGRSIKQSSPSTSALPGARVCPHCGAHDHTVRNAIQAFHQRGLAVLPPRSSRPPRTQAAFDADGRERLRALLHQSRRTSGQPVRRCRLTARRPSDKRRACPAPAARRRTRPEPHRAHRSRLHPPQGRPGCLPAPHNTWVSDVGQ
jgi:DNA-directed RNA polymerase subunit RPC12/RpoP